MIFPSDENPLLILTCLLYKMILNMLVYAFLYQEKRVYGAQSKSEVYFS